MCRCEIEVDMLYFLSRQPKFVYLLSACTYRASHNIYQTLFVLALCRNYAKNKTNILRTIVDSAAWMYKKGLESHQEVRDFEYKKIGDIVEYHLFAHVALSTSNIKHSLFSLCVEIMQKIRRTYSAQ